MRIERVSADSFGPFWKEELELAPHFTIIFGVNESGKSSWHAALYAALCGRRRSKGAGTREDRDFEALHKPWDRPGWEVRAVIRLEDGRRIELHHDLEGRVDCSARDLTLGRDVSNEIMSGTPDASRWLGLDRRSFLATACIRQADLLGVLTDPGLLQEHLQRAAATAGTDATAAAAISQIEEFKRERVGVDMVHSRKPLRTAKSRVEAAERELREAQESHARFSELAARADRASKRAKDSEHELAILKAAVEKKEAERLSERLARASEIVARYPQGPPAGPAENEDLAVEVAGASQGWENRPSLVDRSGATSAEIRRALENLAETPSGDLAPDPEVVGAHEAYRRAVQAIELLGAEPSEPVTPATGGLAEQALLEIARDLELDAPALDPSLEARVREAKAALEAIPIAPRRSVMLVGAAGTLIVGVALAATHVLVIGLMAIGAAALLASWAVLSANQRNRAQLLAIKRLQEAEAALGGDRFRAEEVRSRRHLAAEQTRSAGVPTDPAALRQLSEDLGSTRKAQEKLEDWRAKGKGFRAELASATDRLVAALRAHGASIGEDLHRDFEAYVDECRGRERRAGEALRRPTLESALRGRIELEQAAAEAERGRTGAAARLHELSSRLGMDASTDEDAVEELRAWQERHVEEVRVQQTALHEWAEMESILEGRSLRDLASFVEARAEEARESAEGLDPSEVAANVIEGDGHTQVERARSRAASDRGEANRLAGNVETESARLRGVPEAEETLAAARRELDRVVKLERTLDAALGFLREAQDRVHRDISPVLASAVREWLPELTSGRYVEVAVDPANLEVEVQTHSGRRRQAKHLSHGTREQIYLLLRVALAEHLVRAGEVIPLILDEVTVQCDAARTARLLAILHRISRERQVVLFTQAYDVLEWAETHLDPETDRLTRLDPEKVSA